MTQQRYRKAGRPRRIGQKGARILRPRPPARGGGAGGWPRLGKRSNLLIRADAQQEYGHARNLRRPSQAQGRGEVERAGGAENLDQRRAKAFAARRFDAGAQDPLGVLAAHQRQGDGIGAEFGQPHAVQPPRLALQNVLTDPEQGPPRRRAQGQPQAETDG